MSLFDWLLVGHLVGDWLLQNEWMAVQKRKSWANRALYVHCSVYTVAVTGAFWVGPHTQLSWPQIAGTGFTVFVSHWLIDGSRLVDLWGKVLLQSNLSFVRLVVDQTFHILVLVFVALVFG